MLGGLAIKKYRFPSLISSYPSSLTALVFFILSLFLTYFSYKNIQQTNALNETRYQGDLVAKQLHQRLDKISLMARRYVATGEIKYLHSYNELVAFDKQNNEHVNHYYQFYWDMKTLKNGESFFSLSEDKSFQKLIHTLKLTQGETELLIQINNCVQELFILDAKAFSIIANIVSGADNYQKSDQRRHAISILFSNSYLLEKNKINGFINDFLAMQEARTTSEIEAQTPMQFVLFSLTIFSFLCSILFLVYSLRQQLNNKLLFVKALRREVSNRTLELFEKREQLKVVINEMEETKNQLVESEKMASLGNLVSGVAHEVNTPLGISVTLGTHLQSETKLLLNKVENGTLKRSDLDRYCSESIENCELLHSNLERAANLISSFKQVAVDQSCDEIRHIKLSVYINEVLLSLRPRLKKTTIKTAVIAPDDEPLLRTYPGAIAQIITNLVMNSVIHGFNEGQDTGNIKFILSDENGYLQLRFCDDGKGMSKKVLDQVFEPFFTTRRGNGGSGLGMHIVYNLVSHQLSGEISCESEQGAGTHFIIRLPIEQKL